MGLWSFLALADLHHVLSRSAFADRGEHESLFKLNAEEIHKFTQVAAGKLTQAELGWLREFK